MLPGSATPQLSATRRPKWFPITTGVTLIVVAVALTVGWQYLAASEGQAARELSTARWVVYFLGTLLFLLLIGGLVLIVMLLLREVRLNERQSNFISAVTHELKTPVASLRLYLDTLQLRADLPTERRDDFYRTMRQDLDRLNSTINNVLHAAMYTDRAVIDPQPLDLARLVRQAMDLTRTRHQLPPDSFHYEGPESLRVRGDAAALETAVLNLLDNAVKYSRERVQVDVTLEESAHDALLRVADQGVGMRRAHLHWVFNRFYRIGSEVRRSRPGTGLGLYIVRSVVQGHRGSVTADSPGPDRGSTFTIRLPGVMRHPDTPEEAHP